MMDHSGEPGVVAACVPANAATANWSMQPENWMALRTSWEYGHAAIAGLTLAAFCAISYGATVIRWNAR
jgi:hypothetical protein